MGKKRYDSSSDMSYGRGGPGMKTKPKGSMPMATDTKAYGYDPNKSFSGVGNVVESRLNRGGDKAYKGKRSSTKSVKGY